MEYFELVCTYFMSRPVVHTAHNQARDELSVVAWPTTYKRKPNDENHEGLLRLSIINIHSDNEKSCATVAVTMTGLEAETVVKVNGLVSGPMLVSASC